MRDATPSTGAGAAPVGAALAALVAAAVLTLPGCGSGKDADAARQPLKRFPAPIFDGLRLGMTRAEAQGLHPIRSSLTASGRNRRVWKYEKPGQYDAELTFDETNRSGDLVRIDIHFSARDRGPEDYLARFTGILGPPEVTRRKAVINAYGDARHEQYDTIWSDATQYVYLTEKTPIGGAKGRTDCFLTVKRKEITAAGPPTGYVPPPPPEDEDGKQEEPIF